MVNLSEKLENGYLLVRSIIEVMGAPAAHVSNTLKKVVDDLKKSEPKFLEVLKEEYAEPEKHDKMFTAYVEVEMIVEDLGVLLDFCFNFMPSSVEVLEPAKIDFQAMELSGFLNDFQARLHKMDMVVKNNNAKMKILEKNSVHLLRNNIIILLKEKEKDLNELSKQSGIPEDQLAPFIEKMEEKGMVLKAGEKYRLKKG